MDNKPRVGNIEGMSLRDYFAAQAMQALLSLDGIDRIIKAEQTSMSGAHTVLATGSYMVADAMLAARAAKSPRERQDEHIKSWRDGR